MSDQKLTKKEKQKILIELANLNLDQAAIENQHQANSVMVRELIGKVRGTVEAAYYLIDNYEVEVKASGNAVYCARDYKKL